MIGYYVHHQGEGHRRRATAVARRLTQAVVGFGSRSMPVGWPGLWVELSPDDDPAVTDRDDPSVTAGGLLHWAPLHHPGLLARYRQLVDAFAVFGPRLMVVDTSVEVSLLSRLCGLPVVLGAMPGERTDAVHRMAYDLAEALLAPWPEGAHPDAGWPADWLAKTWHVGAISASADVIAAAPTPGAQRDDTADRRVLVLWGQGGATLSDHQLDEARRATPGWDWTVRGGGHPGSGDLAGDLARADVVVAHAGQGVVADLAVAGRPAVVLAQPRPHGEQEATARALDRLGIAVTGTGWPDASGWPALLHRALDLGGSHWERWRAGGAPEAARRLDALAGATTRLDALAAR